VNAGVNRKLLIGLSIWTVFVMVALWWIWRGHSAPSVWIAPAPEAVQPAVAEKFRAWFKTDLGLQRVYPWLLFGPYVALIVSLFPLERGRLRTSVPVNLLTCALFVGVSQFINTKTSVARATIVMFNTEVKSSNGELITNNVFLEGTNLPGADIVRDRFNHRVIIKTAAPGVIRGTVVASDHDFAMQPGTTNLADRLQHQDIELPAPPPFFSRWSLLSTVIDLLAYAAIGGMAHSVYFYRRLRERERRALLLESSLATSRLNALRAQLQPHFIFNTLNAIAALLRRDPRLAETTLLSLSDLLRLALSQSEKQEITLREELHFIGRYVELQQTRFGEKLRFHEEVEPAAMDCAVPTLLLQPVVENAIRHGIEPADRNGTVRLAGRLTDGHLILAVEDDGLGMSTEAEAVLQSGEVNPNTNGARSSKSSGIGLINLRARLEALYGTDQDLQIRKREPYGVSVRIQIPARPMAAPEIAVAPISICAAK